MAGETRTSICLDERRWWIETQELSGEVYDALCDGDVSLTGGACATYEGSAISITLFPDYDADVAWLMESWLHEFIEGLLYSEGEPFNHDWFTDAMDAITRYVRG